jgi:ATP-dependent helicase YprA (DUF1998 family)
MVESFAIVRMTSRLKALISGTLQAMADSDACALLMFPTKALAQDQRSAINRLLEAAFPENPPSVEVYDGDTPQSERPRIRDSARLLVTNPDMLHMSILPCHASFSRLLSNLRYVVVDESHMCALCTSLSSHNEAFR